MKRGFKVIFQYDAMDCGPACLCMIAQHYGKHHSLENIRKKSLITRQGVTLYGLSEAADAIGFRSTAMRVRLEDLLQAPLPCIIHWNQNHFIVLYGIREKKRKIELMLADPAKGNVACNETDFCQSWISTRNNGAESGIVLILEPTRAFYKTEVEATDKRSFRFLLSYIKPYRSMVRQLIWGLLAGCLLQLLLPFLTQAVV
ncbi:MAG: cysteine peptidase family C39 domain-containing protein, partial [Bacteroidota bacterium]|nr:cysteine peptidase family C39 domain-containing protein [Bacteroidota bacterium]